MSFYKTVDSLQIKLDKGYRRKQKNKAKYLKIRKRLFARYMRGEITMDEMEAEKDRAAKRYLNG